MGTQIHSKYEALKQKWKDVTMIFSSHKVAD